MVNNQIEEKMEKVTQTYEQGPLGYLENDALGILIHANITHDKVVIIGFAKSGKTTFANKLKKCPELKDHKFFHTDVYGERHGHVPALYALIEELNVRSQAGDQKWIIEGVMGVRLLRKIEQKNLKVHRPDLIVEMRTQRPPNPKHMFLNKGVWKIWNDYLDIRRVTIPVLRVESR